MCSLYFLRIFYTHWGFDLFIVLSAVIISIYMRTIHSYFNSFSLYYDKCRALHQRADDGVLPEVFPLDYPQLIQPWQVYGAIL